jgi:hypothetical protein
VLDRAGQRHRCRDQLDMNTPGSNAPLPGSASLGALRHRPVGLDDGSPGLALLVSLKPSFGRPWGPLPEPPGAGRPKSEESLTFIRA